MKQGGLGGGTHPLILPRLALVHRQLPRGIWNSLCSELNPAPSQPFPTRMGFLSQHHVPCGLRWKSESLLPYAPCLVHHQVLQFILLSLFPVCPFFCPHG